MLKNGLISSVLVKSREEANSLVNALENVGIKSTTRIVSKGIYVKISKNRMERELWLPEEHILPVAYLIKSHYIGQDEELGNILMDNFLKNMLDASVKPQYLIFIASAVFLTTNGSRHINILSSLESEGVNPISCGASLDFYGKRDKLRVGRITSTSEIYSICENMKKVITL